MRKIKEHDPKKLQTYKIMRKIKEHDSKKLQRRIRPQANHPQAPCRWSDL